MLKLKSKKTKPFQVPETCFRTKHKNYYFKHKEYVNKFQSTGWSFILVNLVNNAFMQPIKAPMPNDPKKIPRKLPIASKNFSTSKSCLVEMPYFSICL